MVSEFQTQNSRIVKETSRNSGVRVLHRCRMWYLNGLDQSSSYKLAFGIELFPKSISYHGIRVTFHPKFGLPYATPSCYYIVHAPNVQLCVLGEC